MTCKGMQLACLCGGGVQSITQAGQHEAAGQLVYGRAESHDRERLRAMLGNERQRHQR